MALVGLTRWQPRQRGHVFPTCGRRLPHIRSLTADVQGREPRMTAVFTGLSGSFSGMRTTSKATAADDGRGRDVLGFRCITHGTIPFLWWREVVRRAHARRAHVLWGRAHTRPVGVGRRASFDLGLGHFFRTRTK
ncbi:UNVERIFIED_CONTAM: hypothetical protein Sindi_2674200 [Sesamum indicum]